MLEMLRAWMKFCWMNRIRRVRCDCCERLHWSYGTGGPNYCSQECVEEDLPF